MNSDFPWKLILDVHGITNILTHSICIIIIIFFFTYNAVLVEYFDDDGGRCSFYLVDHAVQDHLVKHQHFVPSGIQSLVDYFEYTGTDHQTQCEKMDRTDQRHRTQSDYVPDIYGT